MAKPHNISRELRKVLKENPRPAARLGKDVTTADVVKAHADQVNNARKTVAHRKETQSEEEGQVMTAAVCARKSTRGCLLVMLCLLAFATPAAAEPAWVLWEHSVLWDASSPEDPVVGASWERVRAEIFATEPECLTAALRAATSKYAAESRRRYAHTANPQLDGNRVRVLMEFSDTLIISFECLPDTVDPRGPKGGSR